jgi:hypothetical protein
MIMLVLLPVSFRSGCGVRHEKKAPDERREPWCPCAKSVFGYARSGREPPDVGRHQYRAKNPLRASMAD